MVEGQRREMHIKERRTNPETDHQQPKPIRTVSMKGPARQIVSEMLSIVGALNMAKCRTGRAENWIGKEGSSLLDRYE